MSPRTGKEAAGGRTSPSRKKRGRASSGNVRTRGKTARGKAISAKLQHPLFLPLLTVWLLAVLILAGILYWGGGPSKSPHPVDRSGAGQGSPHKVQTAVETSKSTSPGRNRQEAKSSGLSTEGPQTVAPPDRQPGLPKDAPQQRPQASQAENQGAHAVPGKPVIEPLPHFESRDIPPDEPRAVQRERLARVDLNAAAPKPVPPPSPPAPSLTPPTARVAIVIDDLGMNLETARKFMDLPLQLTLSVLPGLPHSREIAETAHSRHHEVMLHLPMEPRGFPKTDPGTRALLTSMPREEIRKIVGEDIDSIPYAAGVNNHMGSRFTENADDMKIVMSELQQRKLYFLDSFTSAKSAGFMVARQLRVPAGKRDVFLDHIPTEEFVASQVDRLIRKAKIEGSALAIGHPYEVTLNALRKAAERLKSENVAVVPAGQLMFQAAEADKKH